MTPLDWILLTEVMHAEERKKKKVEPEQTLDIPTGVESLLWFWAEQTEQYTERESHILYKRVLQSSSKTTPVIPPETLKSSFMRLYKQTEDCNWERTHMQHTLFTK